MININPLRHYENQIGSIPVVPVISFGQSLIVAPHPDDETLGCGGTAALLMKAGFKVNFLFMSDGTLSHPNSEKYPAPRLRALRESEAVEAVNILGGRPVDAEFLAFPDRSVPARQSPFFECAVRLLNRQIVQFQPETLFIPWQNDPHPDHQATWQIVMEAVSRMTHRPRIMEYPIWLWEMGGLHDIQAIEEMDACCVDIGSVLSIKREALFAHQSQVSNLIDDDPQGFRLSEQVIAHFDHDRELFFESKQRKR